MPYPWPTTVGVPTVVVPGNEYVTATHAAACAALCNDVASTSPLGAPLCVERCLADALPPATTVAQAALWTGL